MAERLFNLGRLILRTLSRKTYSQTSKSLSFPNTFIGNPDETVTGPPIKTFGGDGFGINSHQCFLILIADLLSRGYSVCFRANGKSMHPTIKEGEEIIVEPVAPSDVNRGDIILYQSHGGVIAHRVVDITRYSFVLRGDASTSSDRPVKPQQILGKVVSVKQDGRRVDLGSKGAKMLYRARFWSSRLRRAVRYLVHNNSSMDDRNTEGDPLTSIFVL